MSVQLLSIRVLNLKTNFESRHFLIFVEIYNIVRFFAVPKICLKWYQAIFFIKTYTNFFLSALVKHLVKLHNLCFFTQLLSLFVQLVTYKKTFPFSWILKWILVKSFVIFHVFFQCTKKLPKYILVQPIRILNFTSDKGGPFRSIF